MANNVNNNPFVGNQPQYAPGNGQQFGVDPSGRQYVVHGNGGHGNNVYGNGGHGNTVYGNGGHGNTVYGNGGHGNTVYGNGGHGNTVYGNGGHGNTVYGNGGHGNTAAGYGGHGNTAAGNGYGGGVGSVARGQRNGQSTSDFSIRARNDRRVPLKDKVVDSVELKFSAFKGMFLSSQYGQGKLNAAGLINNQNTKVSVNLNTRMVKVVDERGAVTHVAFRNMPIPAGAGRLDSDEYKMSRLVQEMGNELVNEGAMTHVDSHHIGSQFERYQRHGVGSPIGQNAFAVVVNRVGQPTKDAMATASGITNYTGAKLDALLGVSRGNTAHQATLVQTAAKKYDEAKGHADKSIAAMQAKIAALNGQVTTDARDNEIVALRNDIRMLENEGIIELTAMVKARIEDDLAGLSPTMPITQREQIKQDLAKEYLKGMKAYFKSKAADGEMGVLTSNGAILSTQDAKLATLIVATAVFAGAVDHNCRETDAHKSGYHKFMTSNGYTKGEGLGKIGTIFSLMHAQETMINLQAAANVDRAARYNVQDVDAVLGDHAEDLGIARGQGVLYNGQEVTDLVQAHNAGVFATTRQRHVSNIIRQQAGQPLI